MRRDILLVLQKPPLAKYSPKLCAVNVIKQAMSCHGSFGNERTRGKSRLAHARAQPELGGSVRRQEEGQWRRRQQEHNQ